MKKPGSTRPPAERTAESSAAWRAAREQRREEERTRSIERARLMRIARLAHERAHPESAHPAFADAATRGKASIHVGCSGWYYRHWKGAFYPEDLPGGSWFAHYASTFDTVELNAPFYSWPSTATVASWLRQVDGRDFVYTIKVNELITHIKRLARTATLVRDFGLIADLLGAHFGCFLFQLPPSFKYSPPALQRILKQLDVRRRNVVEFRHAS